MARPPTLARTSILALVAALAASGCRTTGEPSTDPGPSVPPPAAGAAPAGVVTADDVQDQKVVNVEEMLQGRFAGVEVRSLPTGGMSVRIRGATSLALSSEPLFVVDGMPVNPDPGGALRWLNPHDVRRIEVLKDIGSTAFWGARGANGVIVITTKL
jgi:TonB-dependent SusC/RagA subfamily outer membrane receptor